MDDMLKSKTNLELQYWLGTLKMKVAGGRPALVARLKAAFLSGVSQEIPGPPPDDKPADSMKLYELQFKLKHMGLPYSGSKEELISKVSRAGVVIMLVDEHLPCPA